MVQRALIIDDNIDNIGIIAEMLSIEDIDYTSIQVPKQITTIIDNGTSFDVIFLDLEMPDVNGYDVFATLKQTEQFSDTPIVAYSVHTSEISRVRDVGFDGFIGKPLDADTFPTQLRQILAGESVWSV